MKKTVWGIALFLCCGASALCGGPAAAGRRRVNPLLPLDSFIPDCSARVFTGSDGRERLFLYGSHDNYPSTKYGWCSNRYYVWSSPTDDLANWTNHGVSFASKKGEGYRWEGKDADGVPWNDRRLYAPDVCLHEGRYWLVSCSAGGGLMMSAADRPEGPFSPARKIVYDTDPETQLGSIDPTLLSDGGRLYLAWGQGAIGCHAVELRKGPEGFFRLAVKASEKIILTRREHRFNEGPFWLKIGGRYYIQYPSDSKTWGGSQEMSYATSLNLWGPYEYKTKSGGGKAVGGDILDPDGCNWQPGNTHGSLCRVNGDWYLFYHRGFGERGNTSRKVCAEKIAIAPDGTIAPVKMTNHGFGGPLDPYRAIEAAYATRLRVAEFRGGRPMKECTASNSCYFCQSGGGAGGGAPLRTLVNIRSRQCAEYRDFDFGAAPGASVCAMRVRPSGRGRIEIALDDPNAPAAGVIEVRPAAAGAAAGAEWVELRGALFPAVTGVRTVYLRFTSGEPGDAAFCGLASFRFEK